MGRRRLDRRDTVATRIAGVLVAGIAIVGCAAPAGSTSTTTGPSPSGRPPSESPVPSKSPTLAEGRREDLAQLVTQLERTHPDPYRGGTEAEFMARVGAIDARLETMTDVEFLMAVMDLTGHRDQDGHTGTFPMAQQNGWLTAWPLWLWEFPDGWRVVAARAPFEDLVGARIRAIGGQDPRAVADLVAPLVSRDNASSLRNNLPLFLTIPEILTALGVLDGTGPALSFELLDGSSRDVTPDSIPITAMRDWITSVYAGEYPVGLPPDDDGPAMLRNRDRQLWTEPLPDGGLYVGYNDIVSADDGGTSISDVAAAVEDAAGTPIVIDLRNDPGGNNTTFQPLRRAVDMVARLHPGTVALLTGRSTFSAAGNFVTDLETGPQRDSILLVGESPGGGLNVIGNVRVVTLDHSGIVVIIGSRPEIRARDDPRIAIPVDVPAETDWAAYAAGRDPVLDAALDAIADASPG